MPLWSWFNCGTNHFHQADFCLGEMKKPTVLSNKSSNAWSCAENQIFVVFLRIRSSEQDFKYLYWTISKYFNEINLPGREYAWLIGSGRPPPHNQIYSRNWWYAFSMLKLTNFPPPYGGGPHVLLHKPWHEQVHFARSSCTAPERVRKRSEFGWKYNRIRFADNLRWKFHLFQRPVRKCYR